MFNVKFAKRLLSKHSGISTSTMYAGYTQRLRSRPDVVQHHQSG